MQADGLSSSLPDMDFTDTASTVLASRQKHFDIYNDIKRAFK